MPTRAFVYLPKKAIFFWSLKVGTTSLRDWFAKLIIPAKNQDAELKAGRPIFSTPNVQIFPPLAEDLILNCGFKSCIIMRDPYKRAMSMYINKFVNSNGDWRTPDVVASCAARTLLKSEPNMSFKRFLETTSDSARNFTDNSHWWTQVNPKYAHLLDHTSKIDLPDLTTGIQEFCSVVDIKCPPMKTKFITPKVPPTLQGDLSEIGCTDLAIAQCIPEPHQLLTPATISLINDTYDIDFRALGYAKKSS
jgi:hypothetical protein